MSIKYLASYEGPSYGSMSQDHMDGFSGLYEAMQSMRDRQNERWVNIRGYTLNNKTDVYQSNGTDYFRFPATTPEDVMDVYYAVWDKELEGWILGDWAYRITVGPKGGIRSERA